MKTKQQTMSNPRIGRPNTAKRILSVLLTLVLLFSAVMLTAIPTSAEYAKNPIVEFGSYPQSKVTNASTITSLNSLAGSTSTWTSYGYYSGSGTLDDGKMAPANYMFYKDVEYLGAKYRGVYFTKYRPFYTSNPASTTTGVQYGNYYYVNTIYWFKFDPIQWRVLDSAKGLVVSETILDAQAYNNYLLYSGTDTYGSPANWGSSKKTYYANNYEHSSIRAWLNNDFYNTAFSTAQKNNIATTTLDNSAYNSSYSAYGANSTSDKIFLLSYSEVTNKSYFESETARRASGSAYAMAQGLSEGRGSLSNWYLRTAGWRTCIAIEVLSNGYTKGDESNSGYYLLTQCDGIRPAMCLKNWCTHAGSTEIRNKKAATCGVAGYTGDTYCSTCGAKIATGTTIPATGNHTWDAGTVTKAATCNEMGIKEFKCTTCTAKKTAKILINSNNHAGGTEVRNATKATCFTAGYTGDTYCLGCGVKTATGVKIPASGKHTWNAGTVTKAATCKETGIRKYTCMNCPAVNEETIAKNPSNHAGGTEIRNKKAATCGVAGYTGDTYCLGCGVKTATGTTAAATGKHTWNGGTVTREPRCNQEGEKTFTCTVCGSKTTETIAKSSHTPSSWITEYEATCTRNGSRRVECQVCKETINRESIPMRSHQDYDGNGYCDLCGTYTGGEVISNCSCDCHKTGFAGFIWKFKVFFWKLFGATDQQYCSCGERHW